MKFLPHAAAEPFAGQSARVVVPFVVERFHPTSVLDVGCGIGAWLATFKAFGVADVMGVDSAAVRSAFALDQQCFIEHDLTKPLHLDRSYDLALSLEVAEHLPERAAEVLVSSLAAAASLVLFSAAIPGQRGPGHQNCQWPDYWRERFARVGFQAADLLRQSLWDDERVSWWYRQNLLVFGTAARLERAGLAPTRTPSLVHPRCLEEAMYSMSPLVAATGVSRWAKAHIVRRITTR